MRETNKWKKSTALSIKVCEFCVASGQMTSSPLNNAIDGGVIISLRFSLKLNFSHLEQKKFSNYKWWKIDNFLFFLFLSLYFFYEAKFVGINIFSGPPMHPSDGSVEAFEMIFHEAYLTAITILFFHIAKWKVHDWETRNLRNLFSFPSLISSGVI